MTEKGPKTLIIMDSSSRTIKTMPFLMNEIYPLHIYCHWAENLGYLFEIDVSSEVKRPCCIVLFKENSYCFIDVLGSFFGHFATVKFLRS